MYSLISDYRIYITNTGRIFRPLFFWLIYFIWMTFSWLYFIFLGAWWTIWNIPIYSKLFLVCIIYLPEILFFYWNMIKDIELGPQTFVIMRIWPYKNKETLSLTHWWKAHIIIAEFLVFCMKIVWRYCRFQNSVSFISSCTLTSHSMRRICWRYSEYIWLACRSGSSNHNRISITPIYIYELKILKIRNNMVL